MRLTQIALLSVITLLTATGLTHASQNATTSYSYDAADRLLTATGAYGALSWTYDGNGNRLTQALGANPADAYAYDGGQLTSVTPGSAALPAQDLRWNTPGVLELRTPVLAGNAGSASVFGQDAAGRMSGATVPGVGVESWAYDFAGRLFSRTVPGPPAVVTQLAYDRGGLLLEEDVNGAPQADYVYLPDDRGDGRPVAVYAPASGTFSYLHDDRLGTPVKATSASQGTVWSAVYQPFGSATVTGSIRQNLRLPGQFAGSLTGWYHNGARDYEPQWGRYVEADPLDRPGGGANIVGYAYQNPFKWTDPSGLSPWGQRIGSWFGGWVGRIVGSGVGEAIEPLGGGIPGEIVGGQIGGEVGGEAGDTLSSTLDQADAGESTSAEAGQMCPTPKWGLGGNKSAQKWQNQMDRRGWTAAQIDDAINNGEQFPAVNNINPENGATRYVNPQTGRYIVLDNGTGQVIHVGGDGFAY